MEIDSISVMHITVAVRCSATLCRKRLSPNITLCGIVPDSVQSPFGLRLPASASAESPDMHAARFDEFVRTITGWPLVVAEVERSEGETGNESGNIRGRSSSRSLLAWPRGVARSGGGGAGDGSVDEKLATEVVLLLEEPLTL